MSGNPIVSSVDERGIARIEIAREEARNAMDEATIGGLSDVFVRFAGSEGVRALVLSGRGSAFSAGADIGWMRRSAEYSEEENARDATRFTTMFENLYSFPRPTIALIQGPAYGGAVGLAAAVDIAIASRSARFALSEVRLGLEPAMIAPYVVSAMGRRQFLRLSLTGEVFNAEQARMLGLVHEVVDDGRLAETADKVLADILAGAPQAQTGIKELAELVSSSTIPGSERARRTAARRAGAEGREGLSAFLEKRRTDWNPG